MTNPRKEVPFRIGQGYDLHVLVENRPLIIGGVHVDHPLGLAGHSDADVLAHAITDALLGAAGLGDIGHHFPDTDPAFKDADSLVLLKAAMSAVRAKGFELGNIDATIIAQQPKMKPWLPGMIEALSRAIDCDPSQINLKAKTNEKVGTIGRCESIAALATALLVR
ncbi:MAG: 2-C-methyl-D-erythritol 2,4-cyclodiphosphate synthase [Lautropia sp.]|nr:2-C-methyl-D-erythritol 2,4-cyclodiphosphate synthase [Lautropia sp.]